MSRLTITFCIVTQLVACCASAEESLSVSSPLERQVCQRDDSNQAFVAISGTINCDATVIEARADDVGDSNQGRPDDWRVIATAQQIKGGSFSGQLALQAGGWYTITVRARHG